MRYKFENDIVYCIRILFLERYL